MQISADVAVVLTAGQPTFRIPLALPVPKVQTLIAKALAVAPEGALALPLRCTMGPLPGPPPFKAHGQLAAAAAAPQGVVTRAQQSKRARLGKQVVEGAGLSTGGPPDMPMGFA